MNYVISIIAPERLEILTDLCEGLGLPLASKSRASSMMPPSARAAAWSGRGAWPG